MSARPHPGRARIAAALVAVALFALAPGCASFRGARLYHQGTAALDRGEAERAVIDLERAAELVPHASEIQNHLGLAYAAAGRDGDALRAFRRAVALDCDNRAAQRNLLAAERGAQRRSAPIAPAAPRAPNEAPAGASLPDPG